MNKRLLLVILSYIIIAILFLVFGIEIGKKINNKLEEQDEVLVTQKIATTTFLISYNKSENSITTKDIMINEELLNTYREIINSQSVKNKVKETYPNVKDIELEAVQNTEMLRAIYVCEDYNENDCIEITNKYVSAFADVITDIYQVDNIYILDKASISTRVVDN